jgi:broad specificity phosphatase PhoE
LLSLSVRLTAADTSTSQIGEIPPSAAITWIVVRHAERQGNQDKLSAEGLQRAKLLRQLAEVLNVSAVYTTNYQRTKDTIGPTCEALNLKPVVYRQASPELLAEIKQKNIGGVVLIVGHSNTTGEIAGQLANVPPVPIAHDDYDNLFLIKSTEDDASLLQLHYGQAKSAASHAN